jgi:hypothetical protein
MLKMSNGRDCEYGGPTRHLFDIRYEPEPIRAVDYHPGFIGSLIHSDTDIPDCISRHPDGIH